jgi:D-alanyl-lipoteichoic acid acyltransferase DltB (MBOAT superfamily)
VSVSFLSPQFSFLAVSAIILLTALRGAPRQLAFLVLNLLFAVALLLGAASTSVVLLFILLGYGLAHLATRRGRAGLVLGIAIYLALFVYLRRYEFLEWFVPESLLLGALRTIGLSFVFFKVLHVMIDASSDSLGRLDPLTYLNYCLNFTTFMMGPIQRYQDYRDQWDGVKAAIPADFEAYLDAVLRILFGLVKAYILAGWFLPLALRPDTDLRTLSLLELAARSYAFWFYLYLNFAGYCDVAIGLGSLFGVRPPENFNKPFLARNISDFWQRQHRSLTLWLTDYVFAPLYLKLLSTPTTARHKLLSANLCLMTTMLVSGLWHGTTVSFLLFGLLHGCYFVVYRSWDALLHRLLRRRGVERLRRNPLVYATGMLITFNATAAAFIFFRLHPYRIREALTALAAR